MRAVSRLVSCLLFAGSLSVPLAAGAPPAQAAPSAEADRVLVTVQDGGAGCPHNQHVVIANPFDGKVDKSIGIAPGVAGVINEAKPLERSERIIALWGSSGSGKTGGVGIYHRATSTWPVSFAFPASWQNDFSGENPHSVEELPDHNIVVATVGHIGAGTPKGNLVLMTPTGGIITSLHLPSAHGVVWDASEGVLYATGYTTLVRVKYDPSQAIASNRLRIDETWQLPKIGGHDIQRRRVDNKFYVTVNEGMYIFDPDPGATRFTEILRADGTPYKWVKSLDARFDGLATYAEWRTNKFHFVNSTSVTASSAFCSGTFYKTRWIYTAGEPLYREDDETPGYNTRNFIASTKLNVPVSGSKTIANPMWVGAKAWANKTDVGNQITTDVTAGRVPYIFLYHFANDIKVFHDTTKVPNSRLDDWVSWATTLATKIGSNEAYVVIEPEWDLHIGNACSNRYTTKLGSVIAEFRRLAKNTHIVNGLGLWNLNPGTAYDCFKEPAKLFDLQGVSLHLVSNYSNCTYRTSGFGGPYPDGKTLSSLTSPTSSSYVLTLIKKKASIVQDVFDVPYFVIDDMAITRCDPNNASQSFGNAGQTQLLDIITGAFPDLYDNHGFRGYVIRTGGPGGVNQDPVKAMGINNENYFDYPNNPPAVTEVSNAATNMQTHVTNRYNQGTSPPSFTANADVPSTVTPGAPAKITARVTDSGGPLSNGTVTLEMLNSGGSVVASDPHTGQTFANGEMKVYAWTWTASSTPGAYTLRVRVTAAGGSPSYYSQNVATITVASSGPTFTASEVASPRTIFPGETTTLNVSVTNTGGSAASVDVTTTIYGPSGASVHTAPNAAQSFAAGQTRTYSVAYTAPSDATLGTYTARVTVVASGGSPSYPVDDDAGTFAVVGNAFTSTATVSQPAVSTNGTLTITATFTNNGGAVSNLITDIELYDPANGLAHQASWPGQSFTAGGQLTFTTTWTPTTSSPTGGYTVRLGVFTAGWADELHWNNQAASTGVAPASWVLSAIASPLSVSPNGSTTITARVTNNGGAYDNANIDVEVYNSANSQVAQQTWTAQAVGSGQTRTFAFPWTANVPTGTYTVKVGVMAPGWTPTLKWNDNAAKITVTAPTFTATAKVSASSVQPGSSVDITATFTATGGSLVNGKTDIEVYNAAGQRMNPGQQYWTDSLSDGGSVTRTYTWPGTTLPGTYTIKLGVYSGDWVSTYYWNNNAGTISVGSTFQPSFTVGGGANAWWVEVYTSNDVTGVDAIGRNGQFYLPLVKRSWGAWAATAPSALANGDIVQFVARRSSDGSTAGSSEFGWLTQAPTTQPGWPSTFTVGAGSSTTWVEVYVSSEATAVHVKVGSATWTPLTKQPFGAWAKAMNVPAGSKVLFRATRADNAKAYSPVYNWLQ